MFRKTPMRIFGRQNFLLLSADAKRFYMAVNMLMVLDNRNIEGKRPSFKKIAEQVNDFFGEKLIDPYADAYDYYIDHESIMSLPHHISGTRSGLDEEACRGFIDYVVNSPDVVIVGGNDNSDEYFHPVEGDYDSNWGAFGRWNKP